MRESILNRIIEKGGMYGEAAKEFATDDAKKCQIIVNCFEQCHHQASLDHWGQELINDIVEFRFLLLAEQRK